MRYITVCEMLLNYDFKNIFIYFLCKCLISIQLLLVWRILKQNLTSRQLQKYWDSTLILQEYWFNSLINYAAPTILLQGHAHTHTQMKIKLNK